MRWRLGPGGHTPDWRYWRACRRGWRRQDYRRLAAAAAAAAVAAGVAGAAGAAAAGIPQAHRAPDPRTGQPSRRRAESRTGCWERLDCRTGWRGRTAAPGTGPGAPGSAAGQLRRRWSRRCRQPPRRAIAGTVATGRTVVRWPRGSSSSRADRAARARLRLLLLLAAAAVAAAAVEAEAARAASVVAAASGAAAAAGQGAPGQAGPTRFCGVRTVAAVAAAAAAGSRRSTGS